MLFPPGFWRLDTFALGGQRIRPVKRSPVVFRPPERCSQADVSGSKDTAISFDGRTPLEGLTLSE
ncbi:MAG: hypothetical protein AB4426_08480 [Xenococcaceae cyanobacterium]